MTTNLWTIGQGIVTRRLIPKPASHRSVRRGPRRRRWSRQRSQRRAGPEAEDPAARGGRRPRRAASSARSGKRPRDDEGLSVEATGETVGEAKWLALRELERLAPGLDKAAVSFEVLSEGERGLLGVGYAPARVVASVDAARSRHRRRCAGGRRERLAADLRELLERITVAIGVQLPRST